MSMHGISMKTHGVFITIYIQQDATLHSVYLGKLLYMFRVVSPPIIRSTQLSIESDTCQTVTATCRYRGLALPPPPQ